jgi:ParB/RepB/Spo0J family partition protein
MLNPLTVKVKNGLGRYRKDVEIKGMVKSIIEYGQIQPIIINRSNELVVGGRRLAACIILGQEVKAVYEDVVDVLLMREWELEENIQRKNFTPAEEAVAVKDIHEMRQNKHGDSKPGTSDGWAMKDTADLLGKSKASVVADIQIADLIEQFPELKKARTKSEITKAAKGLEKMAAAIEASAAMEARVTSATNDTLWSLIQDDCVQYMKCMNADSVDLLLTDPLYGINADKVAITLGGKTGGAVSCGFKIDDSQEAAFAALQQLTKESYRITKYNAHGFVFVAPEFFHIIRQMFMDAGWLVHIKPIIWTKKSSGQTNVPYAWPASCYEMFLYMRKPDSRLCLEGRPDWVPGSPVESSKKIHQFEKPVPLLQELIKRTILPGATVFDPFAGSGSTLEAATIERMYSIGIEKATEAYALALNRLVNLAK